MDVVLFLFWWLGIFCDWATDGRGMIVWKDMVFLEVFAVDDYRPTGWKGVVVCIELVGLELYAAEHWCDCQGLAIRKVYYRRCHLDDVEGSRSILLLHRSMETLLALLTTFKEQNRRV